MNSIYALAYTHAPSPFPHHKYIPSYKDIMNNLNSSSHKLWILFNELVEFPSFNDTLTPPSICHYSRSIIPPLHISFYSLCIASLSSLTHVWWPRSTLSKFSRSISL